MNKTLVLGGSGVLGSAVARELHQNGVSFRIGSRKPIKKDTYSIVNQDIDVPWTPVDLVTGDGLREALSGVDTVFHLATGQGKVGREPDEVVFTRNVLKAVKQSNVKHLIYSSIVGVDTIPYSYYQAKHESEKMISRSQIHYTILRATQFHNFIDFVLSKLLSLPVGFVPEKLLVQPIDVNAVALELYRLAQTDSQQTVVNLGGPQVYNAGTLARLWMQYRKVVKPVIPIPVFGNSMKRFAEGGATCQEVAMGTKTWEEYLSKRYRETAQKA